jgi:type II restriction enzyme
MHLDIDVAPASGYKSPSQIARICSECWGEMNLYCAACSSPSLERLPNNAKAIDFVCGSCDAAYQLKSGKALGRRIVDAGYRSMMEAIQSDRVPNLLYLHYNARWLVENLLLVPSFFFTESCIKARAPLSATARRSKWVGCEILLSAIAPEGKLWIVREGQAERKESVRNRYSEVRAFANIPVTLRGWTLDVLMAIHRIGSERFTLAQVYSFEEELGRIHPENKNVRPKIRQQLQILRNLGLVTFEGAGKYRLK